MQSQIEQRPEQSGGAGSSTPASWSASPALRRQWLREPLLHFLLAGFALFLVYYALNPDRATRASSTEIKLTEDDLRQMTAAWFAQGRPPPTPEQMRSLVEDKVREEILYREGLALGLDKGDTIVKRRIAQKMEFFAEDGAAIDDPSAGELRAWFDKNRERFALLPHASFRHLYFSPDRRGVRARDDAARALVKLAAGPVDSPTAAKLADPFMFESDYRGRALDQVAIVFGAEFARSLFELKPGAWQGPVESAHGWHLIFVDSMTPRRLPSFEEVELEAKLEWIADRRAEAKRKAYDAMKSRYEIVLPESLAKELAGGVAPPAAKESSN